jgi:hypothetical protein
MDKAKLLDQFSQLLNEIEQKEKNTDSFYEFELFCVQNLTQMSRSVVEESLGQESNFRKKKHYKVITET